MTVLLVLQWVFFLLFFVFFWGGGRGGHFKKVAEQVGKEMWLNVFDQWELTRIQKVELWPHCSSCCRELITTSYCLSVCGLHVFNQVPWMNVCLRYALAGLLYVSAQDVLLENVLVNGQNRGVSHPCHLPAPARNPSGQTSTDKSSCWLPPPPDPYPPPSFSSCNSQGLVSCYGSEGDCTLGRQRWTLWLEQENIDFSRRLEIVFFQDSAKVQHERCWSSTRFVG